jgi:hypothetical protein
MGSYGFVSPGGMARNAIEEELMKRAALQRQAMLDKLAQEQQQGQADRAQQQLMLQSETQRLDREREARIAASQTRDAEIEDANRRAARNTMGVRQMIGESLSAGAPSPDSARTIAGMAYSEGLPVPGIIDQALSPPKRTVVQTVQGGKPVRRAVTEEELIAGVPEYVEPKAGPQPKQQPFQWVLRNGLEVYTDNVQPGDKQLSGRQTRPVTGSERKVLGFFQRMLEAERNARSVEGDVSGRDFAAEWLPGSVLENFAKSEAGQKYTQAQRTFTEGRLRKESGAAIPQGEYDTDRDTNFRRPGDTAESVKQKRSSRVKLLRGAANEAGRALQEFYGEDATIDALLSEFNEPADTSTGPAPGTRRTINGQLAEWDGTGWLPVR